MKQIGKMRFSLLLVSGLLLTSPALSATPIDASTPIVLSSEEGRAWVEKCVKQHPEILWLADSNAYKTEEGQATAQGTYSEQLFGKKYIEFDRTIMSLHCLRLILDGSDKAYLTFTSAQPEELKLSRKSFQSLHRQSERLLQSKYGEMSKQQIVETMETALVLGDIGKSKQARKMLKPYGIVSKQFPDHDDFYGEAIQVIAQHPQLCPSFAKLPASAQTLLTKIANLVHYGHVTHLEGGLEMFQKLQASKVDGAALMMDLFIHRCDVAGALGHVNNQSSLVLTEPTHRAMKAMEKSVKILLEPQKSAWDAYSAYLGTRASWLGLNPKNNADRVLTRIGAMLRLFTLEDGVVLRKAFQELSPALQQQIVAQFDVQPQQAQGRTPTYIPATLVNLSNNPELGQTKEERLSKAITLGLPFIARVLEKHKELLAKGDFNSNIPLNFNVVAGVAKTAPSSLHKEFSIDAKGNVRVTSNSH